MSRCLGLRRALQCKEQGRISVDDSLNSSAKRRLALRLNSLSVFLLVILSSPIRTAPRQLASSPPIRRPSRACWYRSSKVASGEAWRLSCPPSEGLRVTSTKLFHSSRRRRSLSRLKRFSQWASLPIRPTGIESIPIPTWSFSLATRATIACTALNRKALALRCLKRTTQFLKQRARRAQRGKRSFCSAIIENFILASTNSRFIFFYTRTNTSEREKEAISASRPVSNGQVSNLLRQVLARKGIRTPRRVLSSASLRLRTSSSCFFLSLNSTSPSSIRLRFVARDMIYNFCFFSSTPCSRMLQFSLNFLLSSRRSPTQEHLSVMLSVIGLLQLKKSETCRLWEAGGEGIGQQVFDSGDVFLKAAIFRFTKLSCFSLTLRSEGGFWADLASVGCSMRSVADRGSPSKGLRYLLRNLARDSLASVRTLLPLKQESWSLAFSLSTCQYSSSGSSSPLVRMTLREEVSTEKSLTRWGSRSV